jgi:hypothetical protein
MAEGVGCADGLRLGKVVRLSCHRWCLAASAPRASLGRCFPFFVARSFFPFPAPGSLFPVPCSRSLVPVLCSPFPVLLGCRRGLSFLVRTTAVRESAPGGRDSDGSRADSRVRADARATASERGLMMQGADGESGQLCELLDAEGVHGSHFGYLRL